jgi:hypothetical protein
MSRTGITITEEPRLPENGAPNYPTRENEGPSICDECDCDCETCGMDEEDCIQAQVEAAGEAAFEARRDSHE